MLTEFVFALKLFPPWMIKIHAVLIFGASADKVVYNLDLGSIFQ